MDLEGQQQLIWLLLQYMTLSILPNPLFFASKSGLEGSCVSQSRISLLLGCCLGRTKRFIWGHMNFIIVFLSFLLTDGYTFYSVSQERFLDELELEAKVVRAQAAKTTADWSWHSMGHKWAATGWTVFSEFHLLTPDEDQLAQHMGHLCPPFALWESATVLLLNHFPWLKM